MPGASMPLPFEHRGCVTTYVELGSQWATIMDAEPDHGLELPDAGTDDTNITDPESQITDPNKYPILRQGRANSLRLRMKYTGTLSQTPKVQVFGRTLVTGVDPDTQVWQVIRSVGNNLDEEIAVEGTDVQPGLGVNPKYTNPDPTKLLWNCEGFDEILVGVKRKAYSATDFTAELQARMYTA